MRLDWLLLMRAPAALRDRWRQVRARWRRPAHPPSLAGRILGMLLLGMLVIYLIANVGLWWTSTHLLDDSLKKQARQWVMELDELGILHYTARSRQHLAVIDRRLKNFPEILFVRYYDKNGQRVLGQYGRPPLDDTAVLTKEQMREADEPSDPATPYLLSQETSGSEFPYLRIVTPLRVKSISREGAFGFRFSDRGREQVRVVGYIELGINTAYFRQELYRNLAFGSGLVAILLILSLVVGRWLVRRWLTPLVELRVPLERLAEGDTSVRIESSARHAEIAAISEAVSQLQRMAEHDPLTGLVNRARFMRILETELAGLNGSHARHALFFIDLDQFKYVNDMLGYAVGDRLLVQVADALRRQSRETDVVSRFGGDEFTILARSVSASQAAETAGSIIQMVQGERIVDDGRTFNIGCSVGIAMMSAETRGSAAELLAQADIACHTAKARGRNTFQVYEPTDEEQRHMSTDLDQSRLIRQALRDDGFSLHYQPIVGLRQQKTVYYEVLLRMRGRDDDLVSPSSFLAAAGRFGLLVDIDRWVIGHALRALARFHREGKNIGLSINLSGQSFEERSLLRFIQDEMVRNDTPGAGVIFEITEQVAVRDIGHAQRVIRTLQRSGCQAALDDFGAGFSSFGYLKSLPVDFLKIDGSFVEHMAEDKLDQAMVRSIINVAQTLGKRTVAESVQNVRTLRLLRMSGADFAQGNYIGKPSEHLLDQTVVAAV